jgi:hypothetical protein
MFDKFKRGVQFLVTKDKDTMFALIKGANSQKPVSASAFAQITRKYQSYAAFTMAQGSTALLIVRNPNVRFVGVVHCDQGIPPHDFDLAVAATRGDRFELFERFWSDSVFWSKYVQYAFKKQIFGGDKLELVEQEQQRTDISSNRDGWVNGRTWQSQERDGFEDGGAWAGSHRGLGDADDIRTRTAVNF